MSADFLSSLDLQTLLTTEWQLHEPLCNFIQKEEDYTVFRSEQFPHFYGANGIRIHRSGGRALADWEAVFDEYFEKPLYGHKTFYFVKDAAFQPLEEEAL